MKLVHRLKERAKNDSNAAFCLANAYEDGRMNYGRRKFFLRKNKRQAFRWMLHAAQLGNTDSMSTLGSYLSSGFGCVKNVREAIKWEKKAFRMGHEKDAIAANNLGCSYRSLHKYRLAYQWFKKAYANDEAAAYAIGQCYLFGQGIKKNLSMALRYFRETTDVNSFPIEKIHAMKLIADIQCEQPPTTDPERSLRSRRMALPLMEKYAECYKNELKRNPNNEAAYWCLSQLYYHHERYEEALPYLIKCRELKFCPEDIVRWLAGVYYKLGMLQDEINLYQSCLETNPKDKWAKRCLKDALKDKKKLETGGIDEK